MCGNVQIAHGTFRATEHAVVVDCKTSCEPVWLFHYLKYDNLGRLATGAAQPGLSLKDLKLVPVQLPPKDRQVEFISFVSQVDKSRFVEMFGDPVTAVSDITLGEVANMKAGKTTTAKTIHDVYAPGLYPCYGGNGFRGYSAEPTHEGVSR